MEHNEKILRQSLNQYGLFVIGDVKTSVVNYNNILEEVDRRNNKVKSIIRGTLFVVIWLAVLVLVSATLKSEFLGFMFGMAWGAVLLLFPIAIGDFYKSEKVFVKGKWRKYL